MKLSKIAKALIKGADKKSKRKRGWPGRSNYGYQPYGYPAPRPKGLKAMIVAAILSRLTRARS